MKGFLLIFAATIAGAYGLEPTNYDLSRNKLGNGPGNGLESENYRISRKIVGDGSSYGFGIREFLDFLLAGAYGQYYPNYPNGGYYGGQYGGQYQGGYNPGLAGPPGAHPGCPLCDSSVYSYCSYKQAHDACCCNSPSFMSFGCRSSCNFLYANSCQEFNLISSCCCVDLLNKNAGAVPLPAVPPIHA